MHIVKCLSDATKSFVESDKQNQSIELLYASISPLTDAYLHNSSKKEERISKRNLLEVYINDLLIDGINFNFLLRFSMMILMI